MTNTDEAFKRYCETHGPCNRVVFDLAFQMGRESIMSEAIKLVQAVKCYEFRGSEIDDVDGVNWFDARDEFLRKHN